MTGVLTYVINDRYAVVGAQPDEVFRNALAQIMNRRIDRTCASPFDLLQLICSKGDEIYKYFLQACSALGRDNEESPSVPERYCTHQSIKEECNPF